MTNDSIIEYCLGKIGAYIDFPFGEDYCVIKVRKRIFAQVFCLKGVDSVTLNCTYEMGQIYRQEFDGIVVRGYHCPAVQQRYFNTMPTDKIPDEILKEMIDHSYNTVVGKLPKYIQKELKA